MWITLWRGGRQQIIASEKGTCAFLKFGGETGEHGGGKGTKD